MKSSDLSRALLAATAADEDPGIVDFLLQGVGNLGKAVYDSLDLGAQPSDACAIERIRSGGSIVAASVARQSTSDAVLDHVVDRDRRLAVRRAVLTNPVLGAERCRKVLLEALGKDDTETYQLAARTAPPAVTFSACLEHGLTDAQEASLRSAFSREIDRDAALAVLTGPFPKLASEVLTVVGDGHAEGLSLDEALEAVRLPADAVVGALLQSQAVLTPSQVATMVAMEEGWAPSARYARCRFDAAASVVCFRDGSPWLRNFVLQSGTYSRELIELVAGRGSAGELHNACLVALDDEQASGLLVGVLRCLGEQHVQVQTYASSSFRSVQWTVPAAERLLEWLSGDESLALLRLGHLKLTSKWLSGDFRSTPRPGDVEALVADPGRAFVELGEEPGDAHTVRQALAGPMNPAQTVLDRPWGPELAELTPSLVTRVRTRTALASYVMDRLRSRFGSNHLLWQHAVSLAPGYSGTLEELIKVCAASTGEDLLPVPVTTDDDSGTAAQATLFD